MLITVLLHRQPNQHATAIARAWYVGGVADEITRATWDTYGTLSARQALSDCCHKILDALAAEDARSASARHGVQQALPYGKSIDTSASAT
jgi:hypothetical protein